MEVSKTTTQTKMYQVHLIGPRVWKGVRSNWFAISILLIGAYHIFAFVLNLPRLFASWPIAFQELAYVLMMAWGLSISSLMEVCIQLCSTQSGRLFVLKKIAGIMLTMMWACFLSTLLSFLLAMLPGATQSLPFLVLFVVLGAILGLFFGLTDAFPKVFREQSDY